MKRILALLLILFVVMSSCKLKQEDDTPTGSNGNSTTEDMLIVQPNGGDTLKDGTNYEIQWESRFTTQVNIEYTNDNGSTWYVIADSISNSGTYQWFPVPNTYSNQCFIRISTIDLDYMDVSDQPFSIVKNSNKAISLITPNGGERWIAGSENAIRWYSAGIDSVRIDYTINNGRDWILIDVDTRNTGIYFWRSLPNTTSTLAKVRIMDAEEGYPSDESNDFFEIEPEPTIVVIIPNGEEEWITGTDQVIEWYSENIRDVKIDYTTNNGRDWFSIVDSVASVGFYTWENIPDHRSDLCKVRVADADDGAPWDVSDSPFRISNQIVQSIQVLSPNGGERWRVKQSHNITWNSNAITTVNIDYTINNGLTWNSIVTNLPSSGSYNWILPDLVNSTQCKIRVRDAVDQSPSDESDATFSIMPTPEITAITFPTNGAELIAGETYTIRWESTGIEKVKIDYNPLNSGYWGDWWVLADSAEGSSGTFQASFSQISNTYVLRITAVDNSASLTSGVFKVIPAPSITVLQPNGLEQWITYPLFNTYEIKWRSSNVANVKIEWTTNGGGTWYPVPGAENTVSDGIFAWQLSHDGGVQPDSSDNCLIKISNATTQNPSDISDAAFSIHSSKLLHLDYPNNGEDFYKGGTAAQQIMAIGWTSYAVAFVDIYYSLDDGVTWVQLVANYQSTGIYGWDYDPLLQPSKLGRLLIIEAGKNPADPDPTIIRDVNDIPFWLNVKKIEGSKL